MQKALPIFEDCARKSRLKLPQFPIAKYKVKIEPSKVNKKKELEEEEDPEEYPKKESEGELRKVDEASDPDSD